MTVPYTFKNAVGTIPLAQLDDNFTAVVDTTTLASATGAASVGFSSTGTIVATTVQTAIAETNTDLIAGLALKVNIADLIASAVDFAISETSVVVTNALVSVDSIIICTVGTVDATLKSVVAVAAAGSFTMTANAAATATTRVNFLIIN